MGNFLRVDREGTYEMSSTRPRIGIDHHTVVPAPATPDEREERSAPDTDEA
jgi:hypothetical protein